MDEKAADCESTFWVDALSYFAGWARQERINKRLPSLNSTMAGAYLNDRL
jgi:hypothetical protein